MAPIAFLRRIAGASWLRMLSMSRWLYRMAAALVVALTLAAPALAQHHFHGGFHRSFHGGFHGPFFRGGVFLGAPYAVFPDPFAGYAYSYPAYPPQTAWYCPDPPGYYPYVGQCAVTWQAVPAG